MREFKLQVKGTLTPEILADVKGWIGRGVKTAYVGDDGSLILVMTDGQEINIGVISGGGTLPIASSDILGGIKVGDSLKISPDGVLSVDTAKAIEEDNTKPVTSAAVFTEVGNIEALLRTV